MRYPNVFGLGDVGSSPNSKTGAAIRKQALVVVANLDGVLQKRPLPASYDGYFLMPDRHVFARDAARRVRLRPDAGTVVPVSGSDGTAPGAHQISLDREVMADAGCRMPAMSA